MRSGKHRKRRRKHGVHHIQPKKRLERSATPYSLRRFPTSTAENHSQAAPLNDPSLPDIPAFPQTVIFADEVENNGDSRILGKAKSEEVVKRNEENEYDPKLSELKATTTNGYDADKLAVQFEEAKLSAGNSHMDSQPKGVGMEPDQSGRCRGAKRRKSGSVKRFKKDSYDGETVNTQIPNAAPVGTAEPEQTGISDSAGQNSHRKTEHARPASNIVKIVKPVGYSAAVASTMQDVLVTFVAVRLVTQQL